MKLTRITSGGKFIPEIDGLRFIAIASVVIFHIYEYLHTRSGISIAGPLGTALTNGQRGVPLFFVISGFILGRPFAMHYLRGTPAPKLGEYFTRRLTRLEPPYLIALIAVFLGLAAFSSNRGVPHLLASLLYSHGIIYGAPNPFFGLAWSLEIEVQFYCLIPLLALIYCTPRVYRRSFLALLMFAGAFHLLALPERINLSILGWIQCFAAGLLLADLYSSEWDTRQHWGFDLMGVLLLSSVFLVPNRAFWILAPLLALGLYVSAFRSFAFRKMLNVGAIVTIGGMCYTIYLVHYPVISLAGKVAKAPLAMVAISLVAIATASLLFFMLIERPCMDKTWPAKLRGIFSNANEHQDISRASHRGAIEKEVNSRS